MNTKSGSSAATAESTSRRPWRRLRNLIGSAAALGIAFTGFALPAQLATPAAAATEAIRTDAFCAAHALSRTDDSGSVEVALPFSVNFFGETHSGLWVNNNGNVTFNGSMGNFTPHALTGATGIPLIAVYFADVDTTELTSNVVTYGTTPTQFCANWVGVSHYGSDGSEDDKLISAQLVITDISSETGNAGDVRIELNYSDMQWETGDASGGVDGLGGTSAAVGFSAGTGVPGTFNQFPGSLVPGSLIDGGTNALVESSRNSPVLGRYVFEILSEEVVLQGSLQGSVTDSDANPLAALIEICPAGGGTCVDTTANATGNYSIIGLDTGEYFVTATAPTGSTAIAQTLPVIIVAGETATVDFVLSLAPDHTISGTVVDENGDPVEATLSLYTLTPGGEELVAADSPALGEGANPQTADATGAFSWVVANATYRVAAVTESCGTAVEDVVFDAEGNATLALVVNCSAPVPPVIVDTAAAASSTPPARATAGVVLGLLTR